MNPARRTTALASTAVVLATAGTLLTITPASAATTCASPVFKRQFFANTGFSGTPKKTDCDSVIDQNWGTGAPASGLPKDTFGVRWTVTRDFGSGGPFTLAASGLDGIRVYLDPGTADARKIDLWKNVTTTVSKTVNVTVPKGKHTLRIDYVNWTGSAKVKFGYTPRTSATADKVKPLAPTGTSVAYDSATGKAKLTWAKNKEMDLAGYRVYRRTGDAWTSLTTTTATSYTDGTLPVTGASYYYEVRAYDKAGNESAGTADQLVTTADRTAPAVPTGLDTSLSLSGIQIEWTEVAGAASYRVYRAPKGSSSYVGIGDPTTASYLDTSAAEESTYTYRVTALDAAGNESARSAAVTTTRPDTTAPPAVTGLEVTPTGYGFSLSWDPNPAPDLGRYVVYRGELLGDDEEKVCSVHEVEWLSADTTSYEYATLPDGEEACLFVDAYDDNWWSAWKTAGEANIVTATELDVTPGVVTPEGSPLELDASGAEGDEGNLLDWNWSAGSQETTGYRVYRWNTATEAYEKIADVAGDVTSYHDTGALRGTASFYWVTTLAADGTESVPAGDYAVSTP
ncbi:cellulose 1,4-beta-cellobiosidase [Streptomyces sp. S3(2020)]|uniref:fibronectin type III domain-containing protein n=1 Tax=Streptomyces sp. S3(2020) TaxID=2732044 RepID=UPI0014885342|nr:PA14 domain-containing protein [Streptomyces sp. S3(2020)]NNN31322.1 cellulose 1,4-beta-cellobiosidase [Streptomyces sp. S3(2020)]